MKIFISADIEGITSTVKWSETSPDGKDYIFHSEEMTQEVIAACNAAIDAGADEIYVRDAHGFADNINIKLLPECVRLIRGWEGNPYMMVQGIDSSFDAVMFIGYHSEAGSVGNPLSHTMTRRNRCVRINGVESSEFYIYSMCAAYEGVPTVHLSGDKMLCEKSKNICPWIITTPVKEGIGNSVVCMSPTLAKNKIYDNTLKALSQNLKEIPIMSLPTKYEVEVEYKEHTDATKMSYFPGVHRIDKYTVGFETEDFELFIRTLIYVL